MWWQTMVCTKWWCHHPRTWPLTFHKDLFEICLHLRPAVFSWIFSVTKDGVICISEAPSFNITLNIKNNYCTRDIIIPLTSTTLSTSLSNSIIHLPVPTALAHSFPSASLSPFKICWLTGWDGRSRRAHWESFWRLREHSGALVILSYNLLH